jgi:hypothetical protein
MTVALHALSHSIAITHPALFVLGAGTRCAGSLIRDMSITTRHDAGGHIQGDVGFLLATVSYRIVRAGRPEGCGMTGSGRGPSGLSAAVERCSARSDG